MILNDITLCHGSRKGIEGKIQPVSRNYCDFGSAFYMGTDLDACIAVCAKGKKPTLYETTIHFSQCDPSKVLVLTGDLWLYSVLAFRGDIERFNHLSFCSQIKNTLPQYDFLIGKIADDDMFNTIADFSKNAVTDVALFKAIQCIDIGYQFVAKTDSGCGLISICNKIPLSRNDIEYAKLIAKPRRNEILEKTKIVIEENNDYGKKFEDIIDDIATNKISFKMLLEEAMDNTQQRLQQICDEVAKPLQKKRMAFRKQKKQEHSLGR